MILKKLTISNFKGIAERTIDFSAKTEISGQNGTGKTTIMDAYFWLMSGKDSTLTDNPNVIPIGATECMPTVEAVFDMDGKSATVRKVQKYKNKDGKESTSNQYIVNEVPMTERDFKAKLEEYGIDDRFLVLSHPDFLLNDTSKKGREFVRNKILFPMAQELSDKEIADAKDLPELSKLLDDYSLSEIEAMNKATLKKINDEIGKDNVIANARIDELLKGKSGKLVAKTEQQIKAVKDNIASNRNEQNRVAEKVHKLESQIMQLKFDASAFLSAKNDQISRKKMEIDKTLAEHMKMAGQANNELVRLNTNIEVKQDTIRTNEGRIEYLKQKAEELKASEFDKSTTVCPTCGQTYPADMAKQIEENFLLEKEAKIKSVAAEIGELEEANETRKKEIALYCADRDEQQKTLKEIEQKCKELKAEYDSIVFPDFRETEGYKAFEKQITDREQEIAQTNCDNLKETENELLTQLSSLQAELAQANEDKRIDERVKEIREAILQAEVNRANAEKVLYQVEQLGKAKNEMLEDSINKHFKLVKWKLFRTLKNGSIEDACTPEIDGFELGKSANRGRETLAKLDIIAGLQKFYGVSYPVFVDNFESVSNQTADRISMNGQLVLLKVTEDQELKEE